MLIDDSSRIIDKFKLSEEEFTLYFDDLLPVIGEFMGDSNLLSEGVSIECLHLTVSFCEIAETAID
jgi:hypothetical protein